MVLTFFLSILLFFLEKNTKKFNSFDIIEKVINHDL